jgi:AraC-like DNA-binding protein
MLPAPPAAGFQLAFVQLRGRLRRALKNFRGITGMTAVSSLAPYLPAPRSPVPLSPPIHPECARKLRSVRRSPCSDQWVLHLRSSRRSSRPYRHVCPIGMHCSCVPIHFDGSLVGVAKVVADSRTSVSAFGAATGVLSLVISETCLDSVVSVLSEEVRLLRQRLSELLSARNGLTPKTSGPDSPVEPAGADVAESQNNALVDRALAYLQQHYQRPSLSLSAVARAIECNPRYLTSRFTRAVGERMHAHLLALRVAHACRLLMGTHLPVKEIAHPSGFSGAGQMGGAFKRHLGVSPGRYRRIFAGF